jgi:hypothetical protein
MASNQTGLPGDFFHESPGLLKTLANRAFSRSHAAHAHPYASAHLHAFALKKGRHRGLPLRAPKGRMDQGSLPRLSSGLQGRPPVAAHPIGTR